MSMTKKDFINLAEHLQGVELSDIVKARITQFCNSENKAFLFHRFWDYVDGKCGPNGGKIKK